MAAGRADEFKFFLTLLLASFTMETLPAELKGEILKRLGDAKNLIRMGRVCKAWKDITESDSAWHFIIQRDLLLDTKPQNARQFYFDNMYRVTTLTNETYMEKTFTRTYANGSFEIETSSAHCSYLTFAFDYPAMQQGRMHFREFKVGKRPDKHSNYWLWQAGVCSATHMFEARQNIFSEPDACAYAIDGHVGGPNSSEQKLKDGALQVGDVLGVLFNWTGSAISLGFYRNRKWISECPQSLPVQGPYHFVISIGSNSTELQCLCPEGIPEELGLVHD